MLEVGGPWVRGSDQGRGVLKYNVPVYTGGGGIVCALSWIGDS